MLNNLIKNNCVVINNINGNISKIIEGELIKDKYIVKKIPTLIFLKNSSSVSKLIIKNDEVEHINDSNKSFYLDKSDIDFITSNKIPFVYSEQEYDEEIFIVNDDINIVCVNNEIWYAEYSNKGHTRFALNIMLNNV